MKITLISYSYTGNNDALASGMAKALGAGHIKITESKSRSRSTIFMDLIFNRTPEVHPPPESIGDSDLILFMAPVWIGQVATPLRAYFKYYKTKPGAYAFISISGGADGNNPKLGDELKKRLGKDPLIVIDLHIADLLPAEPKPKREDTSAYHLTEADVKHLTDKAMKLLTEKIPKS